MDDDQTGWLMTFSDLVLQLFAFVLVSVVLSGGGTALGRGRRDAAFPLAGGDFRRGAELSPR